MTDALAMAADAAIAAGGDAVHLANLAARRTRSPLAPANAPPPTSGERVTKPTSPAGGVRRHSPRLSITLTKLKGGLHAAVEEYKKKEAAMEKEKEERRSYQTHDDVWGDQRSRRASMPDITDVSERRDSLFRQTDSGKSVYNSLEEFST